MAGAKERWSLDTPDTKEAYFIREIFESMPFFTYSHSYPSCFMLLE